MNSRPVNVKQWAKQGAGLPHSHETAMSTQSVTLNIPDPLYHQIQQRAERLQRSVEEETLDVLAKAVDDGKTLPRELAEAIESLALLDDANLWAVARRTLAPAVCKNWKRCTTRDNGATMSAI